MKIYKYKWALFTLVSIMLSIGVNVYAAISSSEGVLAVFTDWKPLLVMFVVFFVLIQLIALLWGYRYKAKRTYNHIVDNFNEEDL